MTSYFGSSIADATLTTACDMSTTTGGVETSKTTTVSGGNHFCEIWSQGGSQASQTSITAPTGRGWVSSAPGAGTFAAGNWSASCTFLFGSWSSGNTVTIRFYKLSSGAYTSIGTIVATITGTAKTTYSFAATAMGSSTFLAADQLYVDLWLTDTSGTGGDNPIVYVSSSASVGVTSDVQITTSTFTAGSGAVRKDIAVLGKIAATGLKDIAFYAKIALGAQKDIAFLAKIVAPPAQVGIAIANSAVIFDEDSWQLHLKADERQRFQVTVLDYAGTAAYTARQKITVDDPTLGRLFSGVLLDDQMDKTDVYPDATVHHAIDTTGNEYFADKRTSNRIYTNPTYASSIVFDAVVDALAAEGVVAPYARRVDTTKADWAQGTLSNTIATSNVDDGDLELFNTGGIVSASYLVQSDWSGGTFTSTVANSGGDLSLIGFTRNWDDGSTSNQTLYGASGSSQGSSAKAFTLTTPGYGDARSRLDFAGQWQNFTMEADVAIPPGTGQIGYVWRCTNWGNGNDTFAYTCIITSSQVSMGYGTNQTSSTTTSYTNLSTRSHSFSSGTKVRFKLIVSGNSHQSYIQDVLYNNVNDGTYTAAGYVGLRTYYQQTGSYTGTFDNFGIFAALSGTWASPSTSIASVATIASSAITWSTALSGGGTIAVQSSIDGGASWQNCSNGGVIPGLTVGVVGTGKSVLTRITLTAPYPAAMPDISALSWSVAGGYVASGTRISPLLSLSPCGRIGSTIIAWNANLPSAATTLGVDTSIDGGVTWNDVSNSNGGSIPGLNGQPDPVIDGFDTNTLANYVSTNGLGGNTSLWAYDTTHSRITATNGESAILAASGINTANIDVFADMDMSDAGGIVFCYSNQTSYYGLTVSDNQAVIGTKNTITLYRTQGYQRTILADGPIAYYRLGEAQGATTAADSSGYGRTGTYIGGFTLGVTGLLNGDIDTAATFNGSNGYVALPTAGLPTGASPWSLEAWVQVAAIPSSGYHCIIGFGTSFTHEAAMLMMYCSGGTGQFICSTSGGDIGGPANVATGTIYHVCATYDGVGTKIYVNGAMTSSSAFSLNLVLTWASIGADGTGPGDWFPGQIDEAAIYPTCLSPTQILNHYNAGVASQLQQVAQASISFTRGLKYRLRATNTDGTMAISLDGKQVLTYTDPTPLPAGSAGLYQTGGYTANWATRPFGGTVDLGITGGFATTAQWYQLWIQQLGDNAAGKSVLTRCRLATTDSTLTPQVLDLTVAAYSPNVNAGVLIPSADYRMQFLSKVFDDLAKQSNYAWWIDQSKVLNFRHRSAVPAPWILQSTLLGLNVDLENDTVLIVTVANDLFRNRQNLTGVLNTGTFSAAFQGDGQTTSFTLPYPVAPGTVPSITLNTVVQKVGKKGTTGAQFYYADSGTDPVIAQDSSLTKLVSTDRLASNFTGIFTTTVTRNNLTSQAALAIKEGGTGIVEATEDVSKRNMMYAAALTYGDQLLARYCIDGRTIVYDTYRNGLKPGMIQAVFLPEMGLYDSQMFITAIDVVMRTQPGSTILYCYTVTASELANQGSWAKLLSSGILLT